MLRFPSRLCVVLVVLFLPWDALGCSILNHRQDVLRARKRSSDKTAMAFTRRTETGGCLLVGLVLKGLGSCVFTLEETAEGEEEGCHVHVCVVLRRCLVEGKWQGGSAYGR